MAERDLVILVNEQDRETGTMDKLQAHIEGTLHRAFSVFVMNDKNELLLQQRALSKYHSGGLWTNTCCSHPMPGEQIEDAIHRRLQEEMGFDCRVKPAFILHYKADVGGGLIEHEYDHCFWGIYNGAINLNSEEVMAYRYMSLTEIASWLENKPEDFTTWFRLAFDKLVAHVDKEFINTRSNQDL